MTLLGGLPLVGSAAAFVFFSLGMQPIENSLFARYAPPHRRATVYGLKFVCTFGVGSLAVWLVRWAGRPRRSLVRDPLSRRRGDAGRCRRRGAVSIDDRRPASRRQRRRSPARSRCRVAVEVGRRPRSGQRAPRSLATDRIVTPIRPASVDSCWCGTARRPASRASATTAPPTCRSAPLGEAQMRRAGAALARRALRRGVSAAACGAPGAAPRWWPAARQAPTPVAAFDEVDFGRWEGWTREEIAARDPEDFRRWQADREAFVYPGGECRQAFRRRVAAGLARGARRRRPARDVLLVAAPRRHRRRSLAELLGLGAGERRGAGHRSRLDPRRRARAATTWQRRAPQPRRPSRRRRRREERAA